MLLLFAVAIPLHFHFDATEFANAAYHTACVSGRLLCTRDVYLRFWNKKYHSTPDDEARFHEFGKIFDDLESTAGEARATPFLSNDFSYYPGFQVRQRVLGAALRSKSAAEFRQRAAAIANPSQAERLAAILDYFERRLRPWWRATGQPIVIKQLTGMERRLRMSGARKLAAEMAGFMETRPEFRDYYLHAVPSPDYDGEESNGTALSNHFCMEITHRLRADDLSWVAVHEFTHALYQQAPQDRKNALMRQFVESGDPSAQSFYMYLNEGLATAVELLLIERNGKMVDDPYTHPYIPRLGKAILPLLRTALVKQTGLYDGFAGPYLAAGRAALGEESDSLKFRYSCAALLGDEDVRNAFLEQTSLRYFVTTQQSWSRFSQLTGILMLRYEQIHFGGDAGELETLMQKHRGFVYIERRQEHMNVYMLGRDNAAVEELGKMWAASNERARVGLILSID